jgi:HD-like signal output (HDOD) protein/CheY-like chemotaxis protein
MSKILIVDDEVFVRELLAAVLQKEGYHTCTASSGREAILLAANRTPDVIVLDITLPQIDGLQVLRVLRRHPKLQRIPVLLLAAQADRRHIQEAQNLGANGYLLKSAFSVSDLLDRVRRLCEGPQQETAMRVSTGAARPPDATQATASSAPAGATSQSAATRERPAEESLPHSSPSAARAKQSTASRTASPNATSHLAVEGVHDARKTLAELQPIITKEEIIRLVNEGLELKPLAPVVQGVITATANTHCSAEDVARELGYDQAMAIRILKLANTSMYARGRPVNDLKSAVARIGVQEIRRMAMTMGVLQCYEGRLAKILHPEAFWEHSIACGLIASAIATLRNSHPDERYFLWGLLHDVGRLTLLEHVPDKYAEVLETARRLHVPLEKVEKKLFMIDHCEILRRALEHWRFPGEFIAPVVYHHHGADSLKSLAGSQLQESAIIAAADRLAHALDAGDSGNRTLYPVDDLADMLGFDRKWLTELQTRIPEETKEVKYALLARSSSVDWKESRLSYHNQRVRSVRVLYRPCEKCVDAYELFLRSACTPAEDQPHNLGFIHVPDVRQFPIAWRDYRAAESQAKVDNLPLLVICGKGKIDPERLNSDGPPRRTAILRSPISVAALLGMVHQLAATSPSAEPAEVTAGHCEPLSR